MNYRVREVRQVALDFVSLEMAPGAEVSVQISKLKTWYGRIVCGQLDLNWETDEKRISTFDQRASWKMSLHAFPHSQVVGLLFVAGSRQDWGWSPCEGALAQFLMANNVVEIGFLNYPRNSVPSIFNKDHDMSDKTNYPTGFGLKDIASWGGNRINMP